MKYMMMYWWHYMIAMLVGWAMAAWMYTSLAISYMQ